MSLKDKVSSEGGESLESLKDVGNGRKKQCAPAGHTVNNEVRDPHDRRMCHNENPVSTSIILLLQGVWPRTQSEK